ncbi:MAG: cysteate synthase [Bacteroidales bacterium]|nr:cysteate synthase [Bacteroidales bacterium]MBR2856143.1 cysteate synthase [Bacteroidales bacterium]
MELKKTEYHLKNVADGHEFEDEGWSLADPSASSPSLVRAVYSNRKFTPREDLDGIYRYADWMPVRRTLKNSCAPVTYKSKGLASFLGLENLYITFSGWNPRIGARMRTGSFKETEAYSVLARLDSDERRILVVQSAGNTARAFAQVCSDNRIPVVICVPQDNLHDLWFRKPLHKCVKLVAAPHGCDYYDAIALGEKLATDPLFLLEGGAKNVARRDGMGTTILSCVEKMGRIPDAYFQAVGSGTGAIAAWENACRLEEDGRFGENRMRVYVAQNSPFTLMYDAWKAGNRTLPEMTPEEGRNRSERILATVLSNRKPPYGISGGLYDVLKASNGDFFTATNNDIYHWLLQFRNREGYDLLPASCVAVAALAQAVREGVVKKDEYIMLNCTGGGTLGAMSRGAVHKEPDLVLSPDLPAEDVVKAVKGLF